MNVDIWVPLAVAGVGALFVLVNTLVTRSTERDVAVLQAQQRYRDVHLDTLKTYGDALFAGAQAVQSYVWFSSDRILAKYTLERDEWLAARTEVERAEMAVEQLRFVSGTLPRADERWAGVVKAHDEVLAFLLSVTRVESDDQRSGKEVWNATVGPDDPIVGAMAAVNDLKRELVGDYPVDVPNAINDRFNAVFHPKRSR